MNEAQEKLLENIFKGIKEEGLHFALALLDKLAGHVNDVVKSASTGDPVSPPTGPKP